jgi:uncharacterized protein YdeI (YjbR/CyaY-like superfamily)
MELKNGIQTFYAATRKDWRNWLEKNSQTEKSVWLIIYHKKSKTLSIRYDEAIEEALCFGWIDGKANKRDEESFFLFFTQRSPKSNWSKINKDRAANMIKKRLMTPAGQSMIDLAKKAGTWKAMGGPQKLVMPPDLRELFQKNKTAFKNFEAFPPSSKQMILEWILKAKKPETRQNRIRQTVELAGKNIRANH